MRPPSVMELIVAKAAYEALHIDKWEDGAATPDRAREMCLKAAPAAIRAIYNPTAEMIDAGYDGAAHNSITLKWQRMIDVASPPEEP